MTNHIHSRLEKTPQVRSEGKLTMYQYFKTVKEKDITFSSKIFKYNYAWTVFLLQIYNATSIDLVNLSLYFT
jgi:hypothetical protein